MPVGTLLPGCDAGKSARRELPHGPASAVPRRPRLSFGCGWSLLVVGETLTTGRSVRAAPCAVLAMRAW